MRMSLQIVIATALVVTFFNLVTGCDSGSRRLGDYLDRAELLIEPSPDSAYAILTDSITSDMLTHASDRQSALYALLLTQGEHKLSVSELSVTDIASSVKYFDHNDDQYHLMKALYYQARLKSLGGDNTSAMSQLMRARSIAKELKDDYWQARADDVISSILKSEESLQYSIEAAELYKRSGHEDFYLYTMSDLMTRYCSLKRYAECKVLIDSLELKADKYLSLKLHIASIAHFMYELTGAYSIAERYGDTLLKYRDRLEHPATELADIAYVKIKLGKFNEAGHLLATSAEYLSTLSDSVFFYEAKVELFKRQGNIDSAFTALETLAALNKKMSNLSLKQSAISGQRNYYSDEALKAEKNAEKNRLLFLFSSIITILLIVIGTLLYRVNLNKKNAAISKNMTEIILLSKKLDKIDSEKQILYRQLERHGKDLVNLSSLLSERTNTIEQLSADLSQKQTQNEQLNLKVGSLLQSRFSQLNTLINEYSEQEDNDTNYLAFYKNMQREIEKFRNPKGLKEIEKIVDDNLDGIITKIRMHIPTMREKDITFIALMLAGLNARAIGLFLGMHPVSTYKRKKQLIKIIEESNAINDENMIQLLVK